LLPSNLRRYSNYVVTSLKNKKNTKKTISIKKIGRNNPCLR